MRHRSVTAGQRISLEKREIARRLRRHMTPMELRIAAFVLRFRRQQVIDGFVVDFYCPAACLIVEVDGGIHDEQRAQDTERDKALTAQGFTVLRVTNDEVENDRDRILGQILARCHSLIAKRQARRRARR